MTWERINLTPASSRCRPKMTVEVLNHNVQKPSEQLLQLTERPRIVGFCRDELLNYKDLKVQFTYHSQLSSTSETQCGVNTSSG